MALKKVMTHKEAECFRAIRRWQRTYWFQLMGWSLLPHPPLGDEFKKAGLSGKFVISIMILLLSPLVLIRWFINVLKAILLYPLKILLSFFKPIGLRGPGERNIQGIHNQFARYIDLPPELYIKCLDEWVAILYGTDKLPRFSLSSYMNTDFINQNQASLARQSGLHTLIRTQIGSAREELSRDLGHYN